VHRRSGESDQPDRCSCDKPPRHDAGTGLVRSRERRARRRPQAAPVDRAARREPPGVLRQRRPPTSRQTPLVRCHPAASTCPTAASDSGDAASVSSDCSSRAMSAECCSTARRASSPTCEDRVIAACNRVRVGVGNARRSIAPSSTSSWSITRCRSPMSCNSRAPSHCRGAANVVDRASSTSSAVSTRATTSAAVDTRLRRGA
jgi:hypothetical protein